ncbi:hypothetical protein Taro_033994 [Colocasia esculenta]|uniref:High mobility group B protein 9 n=1 Tax=Colocasia esculenta TaxID=4460 RepID=A0A843VWM6_COLES|nr:hypothetical protein [Colocasia esculenta]
MGKEEEKGAEGERGAQAEAGPTAGDGRCPAVEPSVAAAVETANGVPPAAVPEGHGEKVYPSPLLPHEEVARDPAGFVDALRRFHSVMGTKFMIPVIGGKELDLHLLYVEVTQRGGLEKVTVDRRWREVIAVFKFPPTTTSASFVLRKYYVSLLHHFEQVHFHRRQGPLLAPPASLHAKSPLDAAESGQQQVVRKRKRAFSGLQSKGVERFPFPASSPSLVPNSSYSSRLPGKGTATAPAHKLTLVLLLHVPAPTCFTVSGTIDGKFDQGYMVTVKMGTETLHGVLYHVPASDPSSSSCAPATYNIAACTPAGRTRRMRKRGWRGRDPAHPKPNRSAYNFFFAEKHSKLKAQFPHREREFSKMIGESWGKLTNDERMVYQDCGLKDKERYRREMEEYRERLKLAAAHVTPQTQT